MSTTRPLPDDLIPVPALFWDDHADRVPLDAGGSIARPVSRRGNRVFLRAGDPGLSALRADATYYADAETMDECPRSLRTSARRTLAALAKAGGVGA